MANKIISGMSQQFYHIIPTDLDVITTSPTRDAIYKYLSQIEFNKFPEFILDILLKVEGHTAVDVTDGQGDEKQDILTINPAGERCLTQCKHTIDYKSHYNGDDLDLIVAACMRKNCKQAFFVTNSDLTPQGKKYITDEEYNRGFNNPNDAPKIDYWNGFKIWERVKNNQDIINKWFGNLGQVHGVRSFKFELTVQEMPYKKSEATNESESFRKIINVLKEKSWVTEISEVLYQANISDKYDVHLKEWFQFTGGLDINFLPPDNDLSFVNKSLYALTVEVKMKSEQKFTPASIRDEIVKKITDEALPELNAPNKWWHITTSQIKSFIYIHDISEPREIDLTSATTFVMTSKPKTEVEFDYCTNFGDKFKMVSSEDDYIVIHKATDIKVIPLFEQKINPIQQYNSQLMQYNELSKIKTFNFYAVENIASLMIMRLRRALNHDWTAFQYNESTFIWAEDPLLDKSFTQPVHSKIKALGLTILTIPKSDVPIILKNVQKDLVPSDWMITTDIQNLSFPIDLDRRTLWLTKDLKCKKINFETESSLLMFKYEYENRFGFDHMQKAESQTINSREIKGILYDIFTIRCSRMLDIGFTKNAISVNIRFSEGKLESTSELALAYIKEFKIIYNEIKKIVK